MKRLFKKNSMQMKIIYAGDDIPKSFSKSIFLAGPTPRSKEVQSWRNEAIEILKNEKYDGAVFIPEPKDGESYPDYLNQIEWETKMLDACDCILFWIPRNMTTLPALTTNIEWGKYQKSEKIVMGFPEDSEHNRYINSECDKLNISVSNTLEDTVKSAIYFIGEGSCRTDGECYVPLNVWNTPMFQGWYKSQIKDGNILQYAKVNYIFKMPIAEKIFLWTLYVKIYIASEDRIKDNEFVIARTDISSVVIYKKDKEDILNSDIVLVKEFRSPVSNSESMVYEIPGGSSISDKNQLDTIISEIAEETGLDFSADRLIFENSRQLVATLLSHKCYLYSIEIDNDELDLIKEQQDTIHGVEEDTERTYLKVYKMRDILNKDIIDWSNIGYILSVLNK